MTFDRSAPNPGTFPDVNRRQVIFDRLSKHLDGAENDWSVPGACRDGRYAVHCVDYDRGNKSLLRAMSPKDAENVAKTMMIDAMGWIHGVYDLDTLDGEEEHLIDGDEVMVGGQIHTIVDTEEDLVEGEVVTYYKMKQGQQPETNGFDDWDERISVDEIDPKDIVMRQFEDDRLPVRYGVARVVVEVAFNTVVS